MVVKCTLWDVIFSGQGAHTWPSLTLVFIHCIAQIFKTEASHCISNATERVQLVYFDSVSSVVYTIDLCYIGT